MRLNTLYSVGDYPIYLKHDFEGYARMVVAIQVSDKIMYLLALGDKTSWHNEYELSDRRN